MALLGRLWPELWTGFRGRFFPPLGGASRASGCPPAAPPAPEGENRAEARTHFKAFTKGGIQCPKTENEM